MPSGRFDRSGRGAGQVNAVYRRENEIDCDNAAFDPPDRMRELQRILRDARKCVPEIWRAVKRINFPVARELMDINGNRVGSVTVEQASARP